MWKTCLSVSRAGRVAAEVNCTWRGDVGSEVEQVRGANRWP